jgi:mitochondrial FAD-linked sulfhydryl oxidase
MERRQALGRATWTVLHTTAAYLSDTPTPAERQGFASLAASMSVLYPGETQVCLPSYSF